MKRIKSKDNEEVTLLPGEEVYLAECDKGIINSNLELRAERENLQQKLSDTEKELERVKESELSFDEIADIIFKTIYNRKSTVFIEYDREFKLSIAPTL